ncbi:MAG TPA: hypothetical protein VFE58_05230 [Tepidisphaeraceae bacterium]|jgi:hypothetical protein|nr:hypothetical protein [Tepidisphaeraceae bacterium]
MTAVDFVLRVIAAFDKNAIPYMTVGSFSTNVYGKPRSTKDADFVLQLGNSSISALTADIGPDFQLDPQMSFETITSTTRYRLHHRESNFLIELFLLSSDPHDQERFRRRVSGQIGGQQVFVPTPEDVVITKLRWSKQGQRPKDVEDVRGVLQLQHNTLDLPYIHHWTSLHGTLSLFEQLMAAIKS